MHSGLICPCQLYVVVDARRPAANCRGAERPPCAPRLRIERGSPSSRAGETSPAPDCRHPSKHGLCHEGKCVRTAWALDTIRPLFREQGFDPFLPPLCHEPPSRQSDGGIGALGPSVSEWVRVCEDRLNFRVPAELHSVARSIDWRSRTGRTDSFVASLPIVARVDEASVFVLKLRATRSLSPSHALGMVRFPIIFQAAAVAVAAAHSRDNDASRRGNHDRIELR